MRLGFYAKLAVNGIRKNARLYVPYLLTCAGMVMMFYIVSYLQDTPVLAGIKGGEEMQAMLSMGSGVTGVFGAIFLLYTNSFLIRRRKREFGLYNMLGMGKGNIARVLFWEALLVLAGTMVIGLAVGVAVSKLAELLLVNIMHGNVTFTFTVSPRAMLLTAAVFCVIHVLLLIKALLQIRTASAVNLLRSESAGEKPPRANWVLAVLGLILLAVAYYLAVTIKQPLSAMVMFFVAVILVILATYLLFIAGSVAVCRMLQKNRRYYYKARHFVSVSSMAYRMKRNGAGLASICILSIMVLVTVSSTTGLYFGSEDSLRSRYPRDITLIAKAEDVSMLSDEKRDAARELVDAYVAEHDATAHNFRDFRVVSVTGAMKDGAITTDPQEAGMHITDSIIYQVNFLPLPDYNRICGTNETLADDEALISLKRGDYGWDSISVDSKVAYRTRKAPVVFQESGMAAVDVVDTIYVVVKDLQGLQPLLQGNTLFTQQWEYGFDSMLSDEDQWEMTYQMDVELSNGLHRLGMKYVYLEGIAENRYDFYGTYGGFFFLGILLSIVFLFAAVLIIYYKQISEGYEDQKRFEIMQKVGMTRKNIRKSINSQLLTVFFLPLVGAGVHLAFAFPMIRRMLILFNLTNTRLLVETTGITFLAFALIYTLVYRKTSNAYYAIVSGEGDRREA
ncbi:MAG: ABC transporter permease [Eubacteriales bacterium]|nr:ABC transporter permease [Eubacteriales bacterium]